MVGRDPTRCFAVSHGRSWCVPVIDPTNCNGSGIVTRVGTADLRLGRLINLERKALLALRPIGEAMALGRTSESYVTKASTVGGLSFPLLRQVKLRGFTFLMPVITWRAVVVVSRTFLSNRLPSRTRPPRQIHGLTSDALPASHKLIGQIA